MTRKHCDKCDAVILGGDTPLRMIRNVGLQRGTGVVSMRCFFEYVSERLELCVSCANDLYDQATGHTEARG